MPRGGCGQMPMLQFKLSVILVEGTMAKDLIVGSAGLQDFEEPIARFLSSRGLEVGLSTWCRMGKAEEALRRLRELMGKLKLTVNEEKTRICKVPEGEFTFLGYGTPRHHRNDLLPQRCD